MSPDQLFEVYCALRFGLKDAGGKTFTEDERLAHLSFMKQRLNDLRRGGQTSDAQLKVIESSINEFSDPKKAEADYRIKFSHLSHAERQKERASLQQGIDDILSQSKHFTKVQRESINHRLQKVVGFDLGALEKVTDQKLARLLKRRAITTEKDHEFLTNILADTSAPISVDDRKKIELLVGDYEVRQSQK